MILVGVDASSASRVAIRWSIRRAAETGEDVVVTHVVDDEWGAVSPLLLDEVRVEAEALLAAEAEYARSIDPSVTVAADLRDGNPMWELTSAAEGADLLVVGSHKTGFVRGRVFGSRSLLLAGSSPVPVAIIPESEARTRGGVVVGVNDSAAARAAVAFGAREAHRLGQQLILVGAWAAPDGSETDTSDARSRHTALVKSRIEGVLREARTQALAAHGTLAIRARQVNRSAAEALVEAAASATLLVIGSSRREAAPTTLGSVAHDVLINLAGPTVVVHATGAPGQGHKQFPGSEKSIERTPR